MKINQRKSSQPDDAAQAAFDAATAHLAACEAAWQAARSATPFDKQAETDAFNALLQAEEALRKVT
jgi:hypothetical protein